MNAIKNTTPLTNEQYEHFLALLQTIDENQGSWIAGFFAAYTHKKEISQVFPRNLTILYGSLTGKGELLASEAAKKATNLGLNVTVQNMADFDQQKLASLENLLIVVSTTGNGAAPFPARELHGHLLDNEAPSLHQLNYAVLALGDSSYANFCKVGIEFDQQLEKLGGKRLCPAHLGDVDVESTAPRWLEQTLPLFVAGSSVPATNHFTMAGKKKPMTKGPASILNARNFVTPTRVKQNPLPSKSNPFLAPILEKYNLHGPGSDRHIIHIEIGTDVPGMSYQPGDSAGVIPYNHPDLIQEVLEVTGFKAIEKVTYKEEERILEDVLRDSVELSKVTPDVIKKYKLVCPSEALQEMANSKDLIANYMVNSDLVDLLSDYPAPGMTPTEFLSVLRPLQPRYYSISSSPLEVPGKMHLTVGVVAFEKAGRPRKGTCSTYLSDVKIENEHIPVFIEANPNFRLPEDPSIPIIMIGGGTGIAPYRAFVQHRSHFQNAGKSWLFFGNRHRKTEFLYEKEWEEHLRTGALKRLDVAFSRDDTDKRYVQHCLMEKSAEVFQWLEEGAHVYLCGSLNGFSTAVQQTLANIVSEQGHCSIEAAEAYLDELQNTKRFQMDVY